ncbi:MAG: hypothetical protein LiPW15_334 [Parcubacteria group bacterium LiPW_15]|nr:MAG: hypothetical protein LiPW15_334 [Parcubacteria group bacterium LiPW_15]
MRLKVNQERHDSGVAFWANNLASNGWSIVYADLPGKAKPPMIGMYIPDVYGKHGSQEVVIEVETADTIDAEHTKFQLAAFRNWAAGSSLRRFEVKLV